MERVPRTLEEAEKLLRLSELLQQAALTVKEEWAREDFTEGASLGQEGKPHNDPGEGTARTLPSRKLWDAQRTLEAATGALVELVSEPNQRIQQVLSQFFESRALFIAAERRIPDLLAEAGDDGLTIQTLGEKTGIESRKLMANQWPRRLAPGEARILRTLCAVHIFQEIAENRFANNRISAALVENPGLRAYVQIFGLHHYTAADHLPRCLLGPEGASYEPDKAALRTAMGTTKPFFDWLSEKLPPSQVASDSPGYPGVPDLSNWDLEPDNEGLVARPEMANFSLAMVAGGNTSGAAHAFDFPWGDLGDAYVVDVGGGFGGFPLQLLPLYPRLKFVVQDRPEIVERGEKEVYPRDAPQALSDGRVQFMSHDFFQPNPVKNADVYWLRAILHDWSDEYCIAILKGIKASMGPGSRILICDPVMNTTLGCPEIPAAPSPLPANYGYHVRYCHNRDLALMALLNGTERTPSELKELLGKAGLKLVKFWETRSMVGILEAGL